ncbi:MAG: ABC transporter ATP-binding protein [Elusimicrobiota bacterium]
MGENLLEVKDLRVRFDTEAGPVHVVRGIDFELAKGRTLGIVGESGSGKSVTSLAIMRLLPKPSGVVEGGEIFMGGEDISKIPAKEMTKIRGNRISMIFQEPMTALNPVHKVRDQLGESYILHHPQMKPPEIKAASIKLLEDVGIPDPTKRMEEYPHQLSGGMRQRVMIAIALACRPDILIADEPTTALDVTIQAQILTLMKRLQAEYGMSIIFITHDLGVIAEVCDEVVVMYAGRIVERAPIVELFKSPKHPYTKGLLESIPRLESKRKTMLSTIPGMVPDFAKLPRGCSFQNRCRYVDERCQVQTPPPVVVGEGRLSRCVKTEELG